MSVFTHPAESTLKRAMADHAAGRLAEAEGVYREVLADHPNDPLVTHLLGLIAGKTGRLAEAVDLLEAAVKTGQPPLAFYLAWIDAAEAAGETDRAIEAAQKTVAAFPTDPTAAGRLARLVGGRVDATVTVDADALHAEADELEKQCRLPEAITARLAAVAARHHDPIGHKRLGASLAAAGRYHESVAAFETALVQCPGDADAVVGIGLSRFLQDRMPEALDLMRQATRLDPASVTAWSNLALVAAAGFGDYGIAIPAVRTAVKLSPDDRVVHGQLIALLNYVSGHEPGVVLAESRRWAERFTVPPLADDFRAIERDPGRTLRVGFVSPDLRHHSVCFFAASVFGQRDRGRLWVACYAEVPVPDDMTRRVESVVDAWRSTVGVSDHDVAAQIRADRIDILIDLCGHLTGNRLAVLALKPAPIQMTWLGYPNTTGIPAIDFRITDANADPPGSADALYIETLIRLPDAFFVYTPVPDAPPVTPLPMLTTGRPTLGVFHLLQKVPDSAYELWAAAMAAVPAARLLWVGVTDELRPMVLDRLARFGVTADRVEFTGRLSLADFLTAHGRVDFALDTWPWVGHTTTCHGLWMGVPTLSLAGPAAVSRAGKSVMASIGLDPGWIADTPQQFAAMAAARAADAPALAALRAGLRDRMLQSPITDTVRFTRTFESALRTVWEEWCRSDPGTWGVPGGSPAASAGVR